MPRARRLTRRAHFGALAQCLQEVAGLRGSRSLLLWQGPPFDLRLDEFGNRFLIAVVESLGVERPLFRIDDVLGEVEHLPFDLYIRQLLEGFLRGAHLIIEVQRRADQAIAVRPDQHCAELAEEDSSRQRDNLGLAHAVAQQLERVCTHFVRRQIIGLIEVDVVDFVARNERLDLQRFVAAGYCRRHFFRLEHDIVAVLDLIAFDLFIPLDRLTGLAIDEFSADTISGRAVERVEGNALG